MDQVGQHPASVPSPDHHGLLMRHRPVAAHGTATGTGLEEVPYNPVPPCDSPSAASSDGGVSERRSDGGNECLLLEGVGTDGAVSQPQRRLAVSIDDAIERLGMGRFQTRILWAAGLCFAADAMEVLLLSFLAAVLQVEWNLTPAQAATLTSLVFVGALGGTLTLGPLGDRLGRKPVFTLTAAIIAIFGLATAAAPDFTSLLIIRFFVGFGVGGLTVPFDTLAEFIPTSHRGSNLLLVEYFWTAGTLLTPVAAYLTLGQLGGDAAWRLFVVVCSLPCVASTVVGIKLVPESPRWLLEQGKHDTALAVLRSAATINGIVDPVEVFPVGTKLLTEDEEFRRQVRARTGNHIVDGVHNVDGDHNDGDQVDGNDNCNDEADDPAGHAALRPNPGHCGQIRELFSPAWRRTTMYLWLAWAGLAFVYYGTIMVVTRVFTTSSSSIDSVNTAAVDDPASAYSFDYGAILASASAEIAGTTLVILTVDRVGRIPSQAACYALGGACVFALCWLASASDTESDSPPAARSSLIAAAFGARLFFMAATCTTWVTTAEVLTTDIRTTGHAASNAVARLGGAASPFLIGGSSVSFKTTGSALLAASVLTAFATWHLPETAGRGMGVVGTATVEPRDDADGIVLMDSRSGLADRPQSLACSTSSDSHRSVL